jgi:hypothetical protein
MRFVIWFGFDQIWFGFVQKGRLRQWTRPPVWKREPGVRRCESPPAQSKELSGLKFFARSQ